MLYYYLKITKEETMRLLTTPQVARVLQIHRHTLVNWISAGKNYPKPGPTLRAPRPTLRGAVGLRLWSERDVERARNYKAKYFRRGRGKKSANKKGERRI
jgi:predicted DNA-binding transcriptional regulator AlpA